MFFIEQLRDWNLGLGFERVDETINAKNKTMKSAAVSK